MKKHRLLSFLSALALAVSLLSLLPSEHLRSEASDFESAWAKGLEFSFNSDRTEAYITGFKTDRRILSISNNLTVDGVPLKGIAPKAFENNTTIQELRIYSTDIEWSFEIGDNAFRNCTSLKTLELYHVSKIGDKAFANCTGITEVQFPSTNTLEIGDDAFNNCSNPDFKSLVIWNPLVKVGKGAFANCGFETMIIAKPSDIPENFASGCTRLKSVMIGSYISPESSEIKPIRIDSKAFAFNPALKKIYLDPSVQNLRESISGDIFAQHSPDLQIIGDEGSSVEKYARDHGIVFLTLEKIASNHSNGNSEIYVKNGTIKLNGLTGTSFSNVLDGNVYELEPDRSAYPENQKFSYWIKKRKVFYVVDGGEKVIRQTTSEFLPGTETFIVESILSTVHYSLVLDAELNFKDYSFRFTTEYEPCYVPVMTYDLIHAPKNVRVDLRENDGNYNLETAYETIAVLSFLDALIEKGQVNGERTAGNSLVIDLDKNGSYDISVVYGKRFTKPWIILLNTNSVAGPITFEADQTIAASKVRKYAFEDPYNSGYKYYTNMTFFFPVQLGDINLDGKVTSEDAVIAARYAAGYSDYRRIYRCDYADMNGDCKLTAEDAIIIARYAAGYKGYKEKYTSYV